VEKPDGKKQFNTGKVVDGGGYSFPKDPGNGLSRAGKLIKTHLPAKDQQITPVEPADVNYYRNNTGIEWAAKVTLTGPNNNQNVARIHVGFIQQVIVSDYSAVYENKLNHYETTFSMRGKTYLDSGTTSPKTNAYYETNAKGLPKAVFDSATPAANTETIEA